MNEDQEKRWRELSEEILSGMKEWRQTHPEATLREIEEVVQQRMSRLEALMVQETALPSEKTDWGTAPKEKRPMCPMCGTPLQPRGKQKRVLQGRGGTSIHLTRSYGTCPKCATGFFPPR
jgi:RNase P subunit RPR2